MRILNRAHSNYCAELASEIQLFIVFAADAAVEGRPAGLGSGLSPHPHPAPPVPERLTETTQPN